MDWFTALQLIGGLVALAAGAELLVRGASALAAAAGISALVIGLTVVSLGTSSPELAVTLQASFADQGDLGIGNIVGSNIANVLLILGLAALITPLVVSERLVVGEVPWMIMASALLLSLSVDQQVGTLDGGVLVLGLVAYIFWAIRKSRRQRRATRRRANEERAGAERASGQQQGGEAAEHRSNRSWGNLALQIGFILGGLALLVLGSRSLVAAATDIARTFGISELVIGLTVVAVGTSLPEIATSLLAAWRGERDIAVGNAIGSNLFNIMAVLGLTAIIAPQPIPVSAAALWFDLPVMIGAAIACLPIFFTGHLIARWEGGLFLAYYVAYVGYLVLDAVGHDHLTAFNWIMVLFVLPLTAVTLLILAVRAWHERRRTARAG